MLLIPIISKFIPTYNDDEGIVNTDIQNNENYLKIEVPIYNNYNTITFILYYKNTFYKIKINILLYYAEFQNNTWRSNMILKINLRNPSKIIHPNQNQILSNYKNIYSK